MKPISQEAPKTLSSTIDTLALKSTESLGSGASLIIHTFFFIGIFSLLFFGISLEKILLILTTAVSLEAIYLALFIQMSVNRQAAELRAVSEEVEEISNDIDEIQEEVEDLAEEVEEISDDIEEDDREDAAERAADVARIDKIEALLAELVTELRKSKN
jgi:methyl-accepting chemotaxis protein